MEAKTGSKVEIRYAIRDEQGELVCSSKEEGPLEFIVGDHRVLPGFETGVVGMRVGETKKMTWDPALGFGPYDPNLCLDLGRDFFPKDVSEGGLYEVNLPNLSVGIVKVLEVHDSHIRFDANHPLANATLSCRLHLISCSE